MTSGISTRPGTGTTLPLTAKAPGRLPAIYSCLTRKSGFLQPVLPEPGMDPEQGQNTFKVQGNKSDIPLRDYGGMFSVSKKIGKYNKATVSTDHRLGDVGNKVYDGA